MIHEDRTTIHHPTDDGRWVEVDFEKEVTNYDDRTNSADVSLFSFEIIDQSFKTEEDNDEWEDTSWVTWELVEKHI